MLDNARMTSSNQDAARLRSRAARLLQLAATFEDRERDQGKQVKALASRRNRYAETLNEHRVPEHRQQ